MQSDVHVKHRAAGFREAVVTSRMADWAARRVGRLVATRPMRHDALKGAFWECLCDCGKISIISADQMGKTQSCGCLTREAVSKAKKITGLALSRTYRVWSSMKGRCKNQRLENFKNYGGRGISYDQRWETFPNFLADMGEAPIGMQIDRKDNNGHYTKDNCRWATCMENQSNRRNNHFVEFKGERLTLSALTRKLGFDRNLLTQRLRRGWTLEMAVTASVQTKYASKRGRPADTENRV